MRILLDTQAMIWHLEGNERLSRGQRDFIMDPHSEVFVSLATIWEIAIKISIGKLRLRKPLTQILEQLAVQSIDILTIAPGHVLQVASLPLLHRDPFDRMIIAQSKVEFLTIVTTDPSFAAYGVKTI